MYVFREIVKSLASNTQMFQQEKRASIQNLETQISQLASFVRNIETNIGKLPSQAEINPRENTSAMTLRSGREVQTMLPAATPESAANMLPVSTADSAASVLPVAIADPARNIPQIATQDSAATVVQTTQPAVMPGLTATVVQTILLAATSNSAASWKQHQEQRQIH